MRGLLLGYGSVASDELAPALEIVARVIEAPLRRRAARRREPEIGGSQSALAR
jgi:hypothetical protein